MAEDLKLGDPPLPDGADLWAGRNGRRYAMQLTPEGYAVHFGLGCTGEPFNGPLGCYHSQEKSMTTKEITVRQDLVPQLIEFTDAQIETIAKVICVDNEGNLAPQAFVELFLGACRQAGLNPFLKQIYPLKVKGKWTMFVGIDGYRVISERTGLDQGMDGPQWSDDGKEWFDYPMGPDVKFCRVGIWRKDVPRPFVAVVAMAAYRQKYGRWEDDAPGMLAKCAEALARRRAFPANTAVIPQGAILDEPPEDAFPDAIDGAFWEVQAERADEAAATTTDGPSSYTPTDGPFEVLDGTPQQQVTGDAEIRVEFASPPPAVEEPPPHGDEQQAEAQPRNAAATGAPSAPAASPPVLARIRRKLNEVKASDLEFQRRIGNEITRSHRWAIHEGSINPAAAVKAGRGTEDEQAALLAYLLTALPEPPNE